MSSTTAVERGLGRSRRMTEFLQGYCLIRAIETSFDARWSVRSWYDHCKSIVKAQGGVSAIIILLLPVCQPSQLFDNSAKTPLASGGEKIHSSRSVAKILRRGHQRKPCEVETCCLPLKSYLMVPWPL